jgi:PBP1b-binding outer membrane lipoprotein LpoB
MMKRSLIILSILLFIAIIATACGGNEAPVKEEPKAQENSAAEEKGTAEAPKPEAFKEMTVELATIDGWEKQDTPSVLVHYLKEGNTVMVTRDRMPEEANTPEKFLDYVKERFTESFNNVEFQDVAEIGVSDPDKHFLIYTHKIMNMEMKGWITYIFHDKYAYTLACGGLSENFSELEEEFRTFIESFKLVEK